jgi:hypothetical protein
MLPLGCQPIETTKIPAFRLGFTLQDVLGFKKMKSVEIFGNHKKLKNNKL